MLPEVVTLCFTHCCPFVVLSVNNVAFILPSGLIPAFAVNVPNHCITQVVRKFSDCKKRFVLAHSQRKPFRVLGDIGFPLISVLKHFTPSTFAPWNGDDRRFVETYSLGVLID